MKKLITAIALTLVAATAALAQPHDGPPRAHGPRFLFPPRLMEELGTTDAQRAQIRAILKETRETNAAFFEQARQTMQDFRAARRANDTAKLESLKPAMDANRAQMEQIRTAAEAKIAAVLTPEQNAQWQQIKAEHPRPQH